ncbi:MULTISPECIES: glutamine amidotransferase [unclassified Chelatococcus]|jgi:GMP synthase (glutamine-hydrolysing)|uniref:glutamine amidotransferase n=1 Tax=unclassified Chelatococcus TaxID=2638111 RepID=UPI001BD04449|nr:MULTISPECIES: glutamine amidotransferase [unclassified Chelatococcus]CAH1653999.1 GMP synthase (Glutamine-hydrolysing) [Hyphomicrobiales bacterium]MBS7740190.1 glutamine amidotransferase [Chelatococcus sp. HY11]MBX3544981.1 glutamine amidotransferase [Chelatococcus sp.]MCO5079913.1 glutamine amidotransferase [Chelatococcus sp.]CAH1685546.1 GMP synthase (Glutamine-hydrolysing) [Hyphomicrobiales bacterium]
MHDRTARSLDIRPSTGQARARQPVLVVLHQEHSTPGRVGRLIAAQGHALDIRRPRFGDPLPDTLEFHDGVVIFGGPMSANDDEPWLRGEIGWIGRVLKAEKPFLGLCLGAQMLVKHMGGRVAAHAEGRAEIGYFPIHPTFAGEDFASRLGVPWPSHVYQWHREGLDDPAGVSVLATGTDFPVQAIQVGPAAFGFQFHPEVTHAMVYRWTTRGVERLALPGAQEARLHHSGRFIYDGAVVAWLDTFLKRWLQGIPTGSPMAIPGKMAPGAG